MLSIVTFQLSNLQKFIKDISKVYFHVHIHLVIKPIPVREIRITAALSLPLRVFVKSADFSFPKILFYTFHRDFAKFPSMGLSVGYYWNFLLTSVFSSPNFQPLNGSNLWTISPIWMNDLSLECYDIFLSNWAPFMQYFCSRQQFIDFRKNVSCGIIQSHLASHSQIFLKKDRKCSERVGAGPNSFLCWLDYFWVSYGNQIKIYFWIIINKICSRLQKMSGNDPIIVWYFKRTNQ